MSNYEDFVGHVRVNQNSTINGVTPDESTSLLTLPPNEIINIVNRPGTTASNEWTLYKRRWYILFVYCVLSCNQSVLWITFSPVATSTKEYFNTNNTMVNLFLAWGAIIYVPVSFFCGHLMNTKGGLRRVVILGAILDAFAGSVRCLAIINPKHWYALAFVSLGQIFNAAVGPLVMASPSKLSATWFGEKERTTITAVASLANVLGSAVGFLYSPYVVKYTSIQFLIIMQAVQSVIIMIWVCIYFPEKPPTPPSASASVSVDNINENDINHNTTTTTTITKVNFFRELAQLVRSPSFMILSCVGGFALGALGAWCGQFDIILNPLGYSQTLAGWLGFSVNMAGIVGGIVIGYMCDTIFKRRFKLLLIVLFALACLFLIYFSLTLPTAIVSRSLVPNSEWIIILSATLGGLFIGSANPIFLELGAEITFPISEGSSASFITLVNNIANLVLLLAAPKIPADWVNISYALSIGIFGVLLFFVREKYLRKDFDAITSQSNKKLNE